MFRSHRGVIQSGGNAVRVFDLPVGILQDPAMLARSNVFQPLRGSPASPRAFVSPARTMIALSQGLCLAGAHDDCALCQVLEQ